MNEGSVGAGDKSHNFGETWEVGRLTKSDLGNYGRITGGVLELIRK